MITAEQWAAIAQDLGITLDELEIRIDRLDARDRATAAAAERDLPHLYYDRGLDPITLGQWAVLFESHYYKFIRRSILPNRYWIATIWQGCNDEGDDPPIVMESGVFLLQNDRDRLPEPAFNVRHATLADALKSHDELVDMASRLHWSATQNG